MDLAGYRIAAELGDDFLSAHDRHKDVISKRIRHNLLEKHLKPLFLNNL